MKKTDRPSDADVLRAKYGRATSNDTALRQSNEVLDGNVLSEKPPAPPLRGARIG